MYPGNPYVLKLLIFNVQLKYVNSNTTHGKLNKFKKKNEKEHFMR